MAFRWVRVYPGRTVSGPGGSTITDSSATEPASVELDLDQQSPPNECNAESDEPEEELDAELDGLAGEKPACAASRLLSGIGALSKELRSCLSGKADSEGEAAEDDFPEEHRLDRFLQTQVHDNQDSSS